LILTLLCKADHLTKSVAISLMRSKCIWRPRFEANGFKFDRQRGTGHRQYVGNVEGVRRVFTVAFHNSGDAIRLGTLKATIANRVYHRAFSESDETANPKERPKN